MCGLIPLALGGGGLIDQRSGYAFAGIFIVAGAVRAAFAYHELAGLRRLADQELRLGRTPYLHPTLVAWRAAKLTSPGHRRSLARSVAHIEKEVSTRTLPGSSPLNRVAVRTELDLFRELADRLGDLDAQVPPDGMLQVQKLLTSSDSPLYARNGAGDLRASLLLCLALLEAHPEVPADGNSAIPVGRKSGRPLPGETREPRARTVTRTRWHRPSLGAIHNRSVH